MVTLTTGAACARRGEPPTTGENVTSVARQADRLVGREVTVVGHVGEVISAKSFTISDGVERILVLDVSAMSALDNDLDGVVTNEQVRVTGVLRVLDTEEIESYVGELIDARYEPFVGEPVIVADAVTPRQPPPPPGPALTPDDEPGPQKPRVPRSP